MQLLFSFAMASSQLLDTELWVGAIGQLFDGLHSEKAYSVSEEVNVKVYAHLNRWK